MMTEIDFTIVDDFFEYIYLDRIQCVDDLMEFLRDYLDTIGLDREFNLDNIINYYNIDDLDELDDHFITSYDDDDAMDSKIVLIDKCIQLLMMDERVEPCEAFDSDEFADDEE